jgi:hypothetical protein
MMDDDRYNLDMAVQVFGRLHRQFVGEVGFGIITYRLVGEETIHALHIESLLVHGAQFLSCSTMAAMTGIGLFQ